MMKMKYTVGMNMIKDNKYINASSLQRVRSNAVAEQIKQLLLKGIPVKNIKISMSPGNMNEYERERLKDEFDNAVEIINSNLKG